MASLLCKDLTSLTQTYCVDGEKAEQLSGRFAAAKGILPELKLTTRCRLHSAQRSLETALRSDEAVKHLLDSFVLKASSGTAADPGSFCRAVSSS